MVRSHNEEWISEEPEVPVPENTAPSRPRRDIGRHVSDELRDRYFAAGDALYALDTPGDAGRSIHREAMGQPERAAQWLDEALDELGLDRVHLVGSSYGGWLVLNRAHRRPGPRPRHAPRPGRPGEGGPALLRPGLRQPLRRLRLAKWPEQPVVVVPELRKWVQPGARAFRIRRPTPCRWPRTHCAPSVPRSTSSWASAARSCTRSASWNAYRA
ncbi:alpha/beta fold hydrolase [Streptomyces sp. NBC_01207]|uniref:alpha/beta fold hydrolase n=1 Tax=Streptomyces sp. NBC_01207 TaxID=2903772 RepID=UPI003FA3526F